MPVCFSSGHCKSASVILNVFHFFQLKEVTSLFLYFLTWNLKLTWHDMTWHDSLQWHWQNHNCHWLILRLGGANLRIHTWNKFVLFVVIIAPVIVKVKLWTHSSFWFFFSAPVIVKVWRHNSCRFPAPVIVKVKVFF